MTPASAPTPASASAPATVQPAAAAETAASPLTTAQPPATPDTPSIESLIAANPDNIPAVLNSPEAVHAAMRVGDLKLMGLDHSFINPAGWLRDAFEAIHVGFGLPWWGTILVTTLCLRLALFPLIIRMQAHGARMAAISDQQKVLMEKMTQARTAGDAMAQQVYTGQLQQLWKDHDVHPVRALGLPMLQMPLFLSFFFAIRGMVTLPVPQMKEGGLAWFTDLTVADPYFVLPVTSMLFTLAVIQVGADGTGGAKSRSQLHIMNGMKFLTVAAIPFVGQMASGLTFYWTFTNMITLVQSKSLQMPAVKRLFNIKTPPKLATPANYTPQAPPTMMESFREGRSWLTNRAQAEAEKQAKLRLQARAGNRAAAKKSPLQNVEVVRSGRKQEQQQAQKGFLEDK